MRSADSYLLLMTGSREKAGTSAPALTTGAVIRREQPIVYLSHESDGSWVAHGPEPPSFEETWEGSLSVLWALDSTLAQLAG